MAVFAVVLKEANGSVSERLERAYPDHFRLSPTFAMVVADDVAQRVAEKVGIKGDGRISNASGVVFRLTSHYSGYTDRGLWDWIDKHKTNLA